MNMKLKKVCLNSLQVYQLITLSSTVAGDADDVPDSESIRRQNHRLLLKQEKDREHLELIRLQDR